MSASEFISSLRFNDQGLIPVVVQQVDTREVLMVAWMNEQAIHLTLSTGRATYWSRSRDQLWIKGETSGNIQQVISLSHDCDADALLLVVNQTGSACHTGDRSCFDAVTVHPETDFAAGTEVQG